MPRRSPSPSQDEKTQPGSRVLPGSRRPALGLKLGLALVLVFAVAITLLAHHHRHAIYRQVLLARVADTGAGPGLSEQETALELFETIGTLGALQPDVTIDDDPAGTLIRGWGFCDSVAMAFVQVAERRGLRARLLFLQDREQGISPHSVAAVFLHGEWRVFDVQNRTFSQLSNGELATATDIAAGRAPPTAPWVQPGWFDEPTVAYEAAAEGGFRNRARTMARAAARFAARHAGNQLQDLYLRTRPPVYVDVTGKVWENWSGRGELAYWRARNYDVFGREDRAEAWYRKAAAAGESARRDEADYFLRRTNSGPKEG